MSQPHSLHLKIKTNKENLRRFFVDKPIAPDASLSDLQTGTRGRETDQGGWLQLVK